MGQKQSHLHSPPAGELHRKQETDEVQRILNMAYSELLFWHRLTKVTDLTFSQ